MGPYFVLMMAAEPLPVSMCPLRWGQMKRAGNGERMMVDPQNGNIIYMGTRLHGLWRSMDKGQSWARWVSFPDVSESSILPTVLHGESRWALSA